MNNTTSVNSDVYSDQNFMTPAENYVIDVFWCFGILASCVCLLIQIVLFVLIPKSRKFDEKILTQMTIARLIYTSTEYLITKDVITNDIWKDITFALYLQSDTAMICWMALFTKNLYDKLVLVFTVKTRNFTLYISIVIWLLSLPLGVIFSWILKKDKETRSNVLDYFYKGYTSVKFGVLLINVLIFCRIFYVVYLRNVTINRNARNILKTCIVLFVLVFTSSLQVLVTDILTFFGPDNMKLTKAFCVINSYQIIAITMIFVIIVKSAIEGSLMQSVMTNSLELLN